MEENVGHGLIDRTIIIKLMFHERVFACMSGLAEVAELAVATIT